jgi:uncharacterized protein YuzE
VRETESQETRKEQTQTEWRKMIFYAMWCDYDKRADVLYVRHSAKSIFTSQESSVDSRIILNFNKHGRVAGVQVLEASAISADEWSSLSQKLNLPDPIVFKVRKWITQDRFTT